MNILFQLYGQNYKISNDALRFQVS